MKIKFTLFSIRIAFSVMKFYLVKSNSMRERDLTYVNNFVPPFAVSFTFLEY